MKTYLSSRNQLLKMLAKIFLVAVVAVSMCGCAGFLGGLAGGAVGAGAGYELKARQQMDKLDEDLQAGRIDQKEYDIRKSQIERGSMVY
jgi:hypothetical protein